MKFRVLLAGLLLAVATPSFAQTPEAKIWSGIFTSQQAARGKDNFAISCVRCHGADLNGQTAPSLNGPRFIGAWENENLYKLFTKIRDTMPPNFGSILPDEAKLDVMTYILQTNGFPVGAEDLKVDSDSLEGIQILRKGATQVAANFSIVRVVGCLIKGPGGAWTLSQATEPVLSRDQASTPEELQRAGALPAGSLDFQLVSLASFKPEMNSGKRMEAKGLLYKDDSGSRLNVTTLQPVGNAATDCRRGL